MLTGSVVSGGFATVQPDSSMTINAPEGYALDDFSSEAIRVQIAEATKIANGSGSEQDIAEAKIELEVCLRAGIRRLGRLLTRRQVLETLQAHVK